ncbi:MAG: RNA polymerase sigma factor [Saprospiraceae bacterium]|nr:RNA polymerase sigma factor [Saprospiraceae bacterium]MCB9319207.1 RNA polymerase sigma factor [Lewinellaceae bacterium]
MPTDQEIIDGLVKKNDVMVRTFIRMHQNYVYTLCIRLLGDEMKAEEATQDTFLQVFRNIEKFDGRSRITTWMYTIAHNICINQLRKSKKSVFSPLENAEIAMKPAEEKTDQKVLAQEQKERLENCLQQLPPDLREVLTLFYFKELSIKEIGSINGDTEANIKVKLHRGRKQLKTLLESSVHGQIDLLYG